MAKEFDELAKRNRGTTYQRSRKLSLRKAKALAFTATGLKHLRLNAKETIMIGDNPTSDVQGAHN